jgi:hypothetical protein
MVQHPRRQSSSCQQKLNIWCILTGVSWGAGRTVILRLYCCLIHSWIDCGSFIYTSASKKVLCIIDRIHNYAILLSTGASRTVHCMCTVSGEPVLATCWQIVLCSYAANLVLSRNTPPMEQYTRPLSKGGLHLVPRQTVLQDQKRDAL